MKIDLEVWSGGQTGVDQTALEIAKELGIPTAGWIPAGFLTEAGPAPDVALRYGLREHRASSYPPRTAANVRDTDLTVWFGRTDTAGFRCTRTACKNHFKTLCQNPEADDLADILFELSGLFKRKVKVNVAGNRFSTHPESSTLASAVLRRAFQRII